MKTVPIRQIKAKPIHLDLNQQDAWAVHILRESLELGQLKEDSFKAGLDLSINGDIVTYEGHVDFDFTTVCARCGQDLQRHHHLDFTAHLAPAPENPIEKRPTTKDGDEEGIELTEEDLSFSFYQGELVPLEPIFNDEVALSLPINYYCDQPCEAPRVPKAFQASGTDDEEKAIDPRWAPLKGLKVPKN